MANYYAVQFPMFQKAMRNILSITRDVQGLVTTTFDGVNPGEHQYETGLIVRLVIPDGFGMTQLNGVLVPIVVTSATSFLVPIDTQEFDAFIVPSYQPGAFGTPAQVVPVGEVNDMLTQATQNVLPYP